MSFDINLARIVVTVLSFVAFMAILAYAVSPRNRERFEKASRLPFDGDPLPNLLPRERDQTLDEFSRKASARQ